jgi:hypothetical protein
MISSAEEFTLAIQAFLQKRVEFEKRVLGDLTNPTSITKMT